MAAYLAREMAPAVAAALADLPVVVLSGMRQTGKTTLLQQDPAFAGRRYLSLDDFGTLEAARNDPDGLIAGPGPITLDEVQRCPELLMAIKRAVDRRREVGRFLLSGSANLALTRGVAESLAGRAAYLVLSPISRRERQRRLDRAPFLPAFFASGALAHGHDPTPPITPEDVLRGGMPPVCLREVRDAALWFRSFERTYLERDVRALTQVGDLVAFRRLLRLTALRTAQLLNQAALGRDAGQNAVTTGRWLSILEASYVISRIPPWHGNRASRLVKAPKVLCADSGLAAHLVGVTDVRAQADEPMRGALYETYFLQELSSLLAARWPEATLCFWHEQGRHEVDTIVEVGRDCLAIEWKSAARWTARDLAGLKAFLDRTPRCRAAILAHTGDEAVSLGGRLWALPATLVLG